MNDTPTLPSIMTPDQLGNMLWLIEAEDLGPILRDYDGNYMPRLSNGEFSGSMDVIFDFEDGRYVLYLFIRVRHTGLGFDPKLFEDFSLELRRGAERLLEPVRLTAHNTPQPMAQAGYRLSFDNADALDGARLFLADRGRYCFDHLHCAHCGVVAMADFEATWYVDIDPGPAGQVIALCDADDCVNSELLANPADSSYAYQGIPVHAKH